MSEYIFNRPLSLDSFSTSVVMSRFDDEPAPNWQAQSAGFLRGELLETITQHGPGMLLMLPDSMPVALPEEEISPLIYKMADEMGDSLWFCFDVADKARINMPAAAMQALRKVDPWSTESTATFDDIEKAAINHATDIKFINKSGLIFGDLMDEDQRYTSLVDNPSYLYMRATARLVKVLDPSSAPIPSATDLEPPEELPDALGNYLLVTAYVARRSLGVGLDNIAKFNMAKLSHRQKFGKANDLQFTDWFQQPLLFE